MLRTKSPQTAATRYLLFRKPTTEFIPFASFVSHWIGEAMARPTWSDVMAPKGKAEKKENNPSNEHNGNGIHKGNVTGRAFTSGTLRANRFASRLNRPADPRILSSNRHVLYP
jgi:hypothetical protein